MLDGETTEKEMDMKQGFNAHNDLVEGNPAGGYVSGNGISINWQNGPLAVDGERKEPNGAFVEDVIEAAKQRIEFYQESKFACNENGQAIEYLEAALRSLNDRTKDREERGVEGTHQV